MEKATIYRAISAPTALIGGLAAMIVAGLLIGPLRLLAEQPLWFFGPWALVLAIAGGTNGYVLLREARRRGDPFVSPGMKMAIKALLPAHVVGGVFTVIAMIIGIRTSFPVYVVLPIVWCLCYGLGLLAMEHFAPRSLARLGWAFLLAALAIIALEVSGIPSLFLFFLSPTQGANTVMFLTFGLLHVVYAACAWPRPGPVRDGFPV